MFYEWIKYCFAVFPSVNFRGSLSFITGVAAVLIGAIAVISYMFDPGSVQMVDVPPDSPLAINDIPAAGLLQLWQLWIPWLALIFVGLFLLRFSYQKWLKYGSETPFFVATVKDLTTSLGDYFGDGLEAVQNLGHEPLALRILKEAIRQRGKHYETEFYTPSILTTTPEKLENSRVRIIELAEQKRLLENPAESGKLISTFTALHDFQGVVDLTYEISEKAGDYHAQSFQLLYNQIVLEVHVCTRLVFVLPSDCHCTPTGRHCPQIFACTVHISTNKLNWDWRHKTPRGSRVIYSLVKAS